MARTKRQHNTKYAEQDVTKFNIKCSVFLFKRNGSSNKYVFFERSMILIRGLNKFFVG